MLEKASTWNSSAVPLAISQNYREATFPWSWAVVFTSGCRLYPKCRAASSPGGEFPFVKEDLTEWILRDLCWALLDCSLFYVSEGARGVRWNTGPKYMKLPLWVTALTSDPAAKCPQPSIKITADPGRWELTSVYWERMCLWVDSNLLHWEWSERYHKFMCGGVFLFGTVIIIRKNVAKKRQS